MSLAFARPSECGALRPTVENFDEWPPIVADERHLRPANSAVNKFQSSHLSKRCNAFQFQANNHMKTCCLIRLNKVDQCIVIVISESYLRSASDRHFNCIRSCTLRTIKHDEIYEIMREKISERLCN